MLFTCQSILLHFALLAGVKFCEANVQPRDCATSNPLAVCAVLSNVFPQTDYSLKNEDYFSAAEWLGPACIFTPTSTEQVPFPLAICAVLSNVYPDITLYSNQTGYNLRNEDYFSAAGWLGPSCIFTPTSTEQVSFAVKTLVDAGVPFAIQGGGHMPIAGAANIDSSGILLSTAGLTDLVLSEDQSTVIVGSGNHWADVYNYLEPASKTVVGGRFGVVGVPGFLLGGGISFFGNEYGWASANVASFKCVLADGRIATATADNEHSDLFWALRGGGNNFAVVTAFELKTLDVPVVTVGQVHYSGTGLRTQFLQAVYDFAHNGILDQKAAITPTISWGPSGYRDEELHYSAYVFYGANNTSPDALVNFTTTAANTNAGALQIARSTFESRSMAALARETDARFTEHTKGRFFRFYVVPIVADLDAIGTIFDIYFAETRARMVNVTGTVISAAVMPFSKSYFVNGRGEDPAGDPFGVDASKAPYIWFEQTISYALASDTAHVDAVIKDVNAVIDAALDESCRCPYLYLNDADFGQNVFKGYAPENLARLKEIIAKYDPSGVFTTQVPGGHKIAHA